MKQRWPAPERNKGPILEVLTRVLPARGTVLELASGSGQHAVHFAAHLPGLRWLPSDPDPDNLASIRAWLHEAALPNLAQPIALDVLSTSWDVGTVDAVFNANLIHISPWACCAALFDGVGRHLAADGVLVTYGPYRIAGQHTSESNARFDAGLKAQDERWGVRDLADVEREAQRVGLGLVERIQMPANNLSLVFRRAA